MTYIEFQWIIKVCWIIFFVGNACLILLYSRFRICNKRRNRLNLELMEAQEFYKPYYEKMNSFLCELGKQRQNFAKLECSFQMFSKKYIKTIEKSDAYERLVARIRDFGITETRGLKEQGIFSKRKNRKVFKRNYELKNEKFFEPQYINKRKYRFLKLTVNDAIKMIKVLAGVLLGIFILLNVASSQFPPYFEKYYWKLLIACIVVVGGGLFIYFQEITALILGVIFGLILSVFILAVVYIWHEFDFVILLLKKMLNLKLLLLSTWDVGLIVCLIPNAFNVIKIISSWIGESKNVLNTLRNEEKRNNLKDMFDEELLNWVDCIELNIYDLENKIMKYNQPIYKKKLAGDDQQEVIQIYEDYMIIKKILEQEVADDFETGLKKIDLMKRDLQNDNMED